LDILKPEYNILVKTGSSFGFKHTEETKQKMSEVRKGILLGRPKPEGAGRPPQAIEVFELETGNKNTYESAKEAGRALNIDGSIISRYLRTNQKKPYSPQQATPQQPAAESLLAACGGRKGRYIFTKINLYPSY
jgi:hypothetical protein